MPTHEVRAAADRAARPLARPEVPSASIRRIADRAEDRAAGRNVPPKPGPAFREDKIPF
ncbi:hypothetical protein [Methylobacterium indicum]|uniref:hypothetical protein n=1 Tax=Methylobacterium indicum TaxID=1775910 RepID=UPI0013F4ED75|nr:hypothetical protein [Methylobacterium indicum]